MSGERGTYLPKLPDGYAPLTAEELASYERNPAHFLREQRRLSWMLQLAERHRLVPILGSVEARIRLVTHLMPDEFWPGFTFTGRYIRDTSERDLALGLLGAKTRKVETRLANRYPVTVQVVANTRAKALDHVEKLGLQPTRPEWRHTPRRKRKSPSNVPQTVPSNSGSR